MCTVIFGPPVVPDVKYSRAISSLLVSAVSNSPEPSRRSANPYHPGRHPPPAEMQAFSFVEPPRLSIASSTRGATSGIVTTHAASAAWIRCAMSLAES